MEEFNALCPPGSEAHAYYRMVTSYWDMAASFITGGVLNQELFFQSGGELLFVWERVRDLVPQVRELFKNPNVAKNIETVANAFIQYMNSRSPEAYPTFSAMVRAR